MPTCQLITETSQLVFWVIRLKSKKRHASLTSIQKLAFSGHNFNGVRKMKMISK